jgi:hypothetical protein
MLDETLEGQFVEGEGRILVLTDIGTVPEAALVLLRHPDRSLRARAHAALLEEEQADVVLALTSLPEILDLWDDLEERLDRRRGFWSWVVDALRQRWPGGYAISGQPRREPPVPPLATSLLRPIDPHEVLAQAQALGRVLQALPFARPCPKACLSLLRCALDQIRLGAGLRQAVAAVARIAPFSTLEVADTVFESNAQRDGFELGLRLDEAVDLDERRARLAEDLLDFFLSTQEAVD